MSTTLSELSEVNMLRCHQSNYKHLFSVLSGILLCFVAFSSVLAEEEQELSPEEMAEQKALIESLMQLDLEELLNIDVMSVSATTASKKEQTLANTAAALFVITQEDIRRAGITNIPEALRMAPGLQVARIDANKWTVSARGLSGGQLGNKLLVLIDGRNVTPLRSELHWEIQDVLIEDIERIEIVRGPGIALWGANAVNGVINIITKSAVQTEGKLVSLHTGNREEQLVIGGRYGKQMDSGPYYRVYGKYYKHGNSLNVKTLGGSDGWFMGRGGFRADWDVTERDGLTLQGDFLRQEAQQTLVNLNANPIPDETKVNSGNLLSRWVRKLEDGDIIVQAYYDYVQRDNLVAEESRHSYDIDVQHRFLFSDAHEIIWGLSFRHDDTQKKEYSLAKETRSQLTLSNTYDDNFASAFIQSEHILSPNELRLTLGSKFEYNSGAGGFEMQPNIRLLWTPDELHSLWASISRATGASAYLQPDSTNSEQMLAYELGYRFTLSEKTFLDWNIFINDYKDLFLSSELDIQGYEPVDESDPIYAHVRGFEISAHWYPQEDWRLIATYNYLNVNTGVEQPGQKPYALLEEGSSPRNQASLRSMYDLTRHIELDTAIYYVDNIPSQKVPHYTRIDLRVGWQPVLDLNLSLGVRNLLDKRHYEFGNIGGDSIPSEVERTIYFQLKYQF